MRYLSFDLEATGLKEHDLIIEFAMVPFCTEECKIEHSLERSYFIKCPTFQELKPNLDPWVIEHNKVLIDKANREGLEISEFKKNLTEYLRSKEVREYFNNEKIVLFGKSINAIDLPFLNRDLGWDYMRDHFQHRVLDLTSVSYNLIDLNFIPHECESGSHLMHYLDMGEVKHTALEDAQNTALMYIKLLEMFGIKE